ncbi:GntR family transcriptional regulator [Spartinivicinus poritis]|uniref:GntR family transcriptional regulator n=1 Tax=Spartinivicinus poritis TaxID=2994640 RepID=A0ABT5UF11_9GAMM|nr:GntR family transcriptional regulator [Spartinivicinus sp. A2-2]MDE1464959.1 GntR family transcriptional regulator [Spartinivicinus sp. A2-2]
MMFSKQSLEEQAVEYLREKILSGAYPTGEKLVESNLAKDLDLSRTTIRMALNTLANEGLVIQKPYAGWRVVSFTEHDLWEIYHLRVALESKAAEMLAEQITEEKSSELKSFFEKYTHLCKTQPDNLEEICRYDLKLHQLIVSLSGSQRLARMYSSVLNQLLIFIKMTHLDFDAQESANTHIKLIKAICEGNSQLAGKLAKENVTTFTELGKKLQQNS